MKNKKKKIIIAVIIVGIIVAIYFIFFNKNDNRMNFGNFKPSQDMLESIGKGSRSKKKSEKTISQISEIQSATVENVELHATYYLEEVLVEEKQYVEAGTNILKYTNGTYLVAPYNCCIVSLNLPDVNGQCLNNHYIEIESTNILTVSMKVDEGLINSVSIGKEAKIDIKALNKSYTGYITHVGSTASNGKFEIIVQFENDGNAKLGMTSTVSLTI